MGRSVTWLLVGAVAAIVVAAAVEALVDDPEARPVPAATGERPAASTPPAVPISGREDVRELLESAGAGGVLYLTDRDCRLRTVVLPSVERHRVRTGSPPAASRSRRVEGCTAAAWRSTATARPSAGTAVEVLTREGAVASRVLDACAPAWRPDGALTYVRDGELWLRPGEGPDHVVISGPELASAVGPRPSSKRSPGSTTGGSGPSSATGGRRCWFAFTTASARSSSGPEPSKVSESTATAPSPHGPPETA